MRLGEKRKIKPTIIEKNLLYDSEMVEATVTYIHPLHRFYLAEWVTPQGTSLRECIFFEHRISDTERRRRGERI